MNSGVYRFLQKSTGISYIGSSSRLRLRIAHHRRLLETGKHWNKALLKAWSNDGAEGFSISVVEEVAPDDLLTAENRWMAACQPLFNVVSIAQRGRRGIPHTEESKRKMSITRTGLYRGVNSVRFGKPLPREVVEKAIATKKRKKEAGIKINHPGPNAKCIEALRRYGRTRVGALNPNFGRHLSDDAKRRIADARSKTYYLIDPDGTPIEVKNLKKYCREQRINYSAMLKLLNGKTNIMIPLRLRGVKKGWKLQMRARVAAGKPVA